MNYEKILVELSANYDLKNGAVNLLKIIEGSTLSHRTTGDSSINQLWSFLRDEVYSLLCTNCSKYKKERSLLSSTAAPAIALLSATLATKFGLATGTAGTLAAIALIIPLKLSVNTWCNMYENNKQSITHEETDEIKALSEN